MLTIEMVVAWLVTALAFLWAVWSCREMRFNVREELAAKQRRERS